MKGIGVKHKTGKDWLIKYTAIYFVIAIPMIVCLLLSGKTFLWGADSYYQQYTTLSYTGSLIRKIFGGVLCL